MYTLPVVFFLAPKMAEKAEMAAQMRTMGKAMVGLAKLLAKMGEGRSKSKGSKRGTNYPPRVLTPYFAFCKSRRSDARPKTLSPKLLKAEWDHESMDKKVSRPLR